MKYKNKDLNGEEVKIGRKRKEQSDLIELTESSNRLRNKAIFQLEELEIEREMRGAYGYIGLGFSSNEIDSKIREKVEAIRRLNYELAYNPNDFSKKINWDEVSESMPCLEFIDISTKQSKM